MFLSVWSFLILGWISVVEIGPVERRDVHIGLAETEVLDDIAFHFWGSRSRESDNRNVRIDLCHHFAEATVFRAEVVTPFGNTVRFIYSEER